MPSSDDDKALYEEISRECAWYTTHVHSNWRTALMRRRGKTIQCPHPTPVVSRERENPTTDTVEHAILKIDAAAVRLLASSAASLVTRLAAGTTLEEVLRHAATGGVPSIVYVRAWEIHNAPAHDAGRLIEISTGQAGGHVAIDHLVWPPLDWVFEGLT
ncbi:hypothetical protein C8Q79DRAFT_1013964 [Trametes meyenii]|nr:hypothetical protein C8Q79DRAFT_1013964 [Trametes meyenii]